MDRATVIVALPPVDDRIQKRSSEEVPHLTLLYLGDVELSAEAVLYVQHAAKELSPFMLTVDYRGTLGEDEADVLFFEKTAWDLDRIASFRHHLLLNDEIKAAYDAAPQHTEHPDWTPHLTLGYPATPAPEDDEDRSLSYVNFDRIAVWTGDFEGPEFRLKYDNNGMDEVMAMSDISTTERGAQAAAELFHYGTKGMKWGVRKAERHREVAARSRRIADGTASKQDKRDQFVGKGLDGAGGKLATSKYGATKIAERHEKKAAKLEAKVDKKAEKMDKKWEKSIYTTSKAVEVHNAMAEHFNERIGAVNDKHPLANIFDSPNSPESVAYMTEVERLTSRSYAYATTTVHGTSPSGLKRAKYVDDDKGPRIVVTKTDVQHAEEDDPDLILLVKPDESGHILELNEAEVESVEHSGEAGAFLAHYGKKGMKWGVTTTDRASQRTPTPVTTAQKKPGTYTKAKGGKNLPAHEDAINALVTRQKAKSSTTDALSNVELRKAIERMNLENQYHNASFNSDRRSKGQRFVQGLIGRKRYGQKRKYTDFNEELGSATRTAAGSKVAKTAADKATKAAIKKVAGI
jgi:2'-5' RNA ligase